MWCNTFHKCGTATHFFYLFLDEGVDTPRAQLDQTLVDSQMVRLDQTLVDTPKSDQCRQVDAMRAVDAMDTLHKQVEPLLNPCFAPSGPRGEQTGLGDTVDSMIAGRVVESTIAGARLVVPTVEPRWADQDRDQDKFQQVVVPGNRPSRWGLMAVVLRNNLVDKLQTEVDDMDDSHDPGFFLAVQ